jgi:phosphomannomutase
MAQSGRNIRQLMKDVEKRYGKFCYDRVDIRYAPEKRESIFRFLGTAAFGKIKGMKVKEITRFDGTKFIFEDLSWLLLRGSGTEPVLRIYSESRSPQKVRELLEFGRSAALSS